MRLFCVNMIPVDISASAQIFFDDTIRRAHVYVLTSEQAWASASLRCGIQGGMLS